MGEPNKTTKALSGEGEYEFGDLSNVGESREVGEARVGSAYESDEFYFPETGPERDDNGYVLIPDRVDVKIRYYDIEDNLEGTLRLTFPQPNISVDTSTRTVEHQVIGDTTVVQKIGEEATNVTIEGICTTKEAYTIDKLSDFAYVNVDSHRWGSNFSRPGQNTESSDNNGYGLISSSSTSPISEGGAVLATRKNNEKIYEWSHEFTIEIKSIENPNNE